MSSYRLAELRDTITDRQFAHDLAKQRVEDTAAALQKAKDAYIEEALKEPATPPVAGFTSDKGTISPV